MGRFQVIGNEYETNMKRTYFISNIEMEVVVSQYISSTSDHLFVCCADSVGGVKHAYSSFSVSRHAR